MIEYKELHAIEEWEQAWESSIEKPVLLFKHSTTCPISARAFEQYQKYLASADQSLMTGRELIKSRKKPM